MLMRWIVKNPLRRRASRSALVRLCAPKGGGIGRMLVPAPHFWRQILNKSRQFASQRVGVVSSLPITLRLGLTHTRLMGFRAANSACRRLSCLSRLCLFLLCLSVWFACPVSVARLAWRFGDCFVSFSVLSSLLPLGRSALGRSLVSPSPSLSCVCLAPRVSRPIVTLACSDHVQLSPPVDLCVRELSPPLSILIRGLWHAGENLLPCMSRPLSS